jgi:hypothetical protein
MRLRLDRVQSDAESTLGKLWVLAAPVAVFLAWSCEDGYRAVKVPGETRIPAGIYALGLKPLGTSRFDAKYTARFGAAFHKGMVEIRDVPGFEGVLLHIGNTEKDTAGCVLIGAAWGRDAGGHYQVLQSETAYRRVYPMLRDALMRGEECTLEVVDDDSNAR